MADTPAKKQDPGFQRVEAPKGSPEGTPRAVTRHVGVKPGVDVSNADTSPELLSAVAELSTYQPAPDQNPLGLRPAPGPSTVQVLGGDTAAGDTDEPLSNKLEESR